MGITRLLRVSLVALAAAAATVAPSLYSADGQVMAEPQVSADAVEAAKLALKGDFVEAGQAAARSRDPAAIKLVELYYLRQHPNDAGYERIMAFLDEAPNWPLSEALLKRAERSLYANNEPAPLILAHFAKRKPTTSEGALALARALIATGDKEKAHKYIQKVWYDPDLDSDLEKSVAKEFGKLLTADDDKERMWRLVYAQETNAAIRASKRLSRDYQKAAAVAQLLIRNEKGADKKYSALPSSMRNQLGMKYALTRYYRKKEAYSKARAILASVPGDAAKMGDPQAWWIERRIVARHSIGINDRNHAKVAYKICRAHGLSKGDAAIEGEFLAGWIALRYLKDPATALKHFTRLGEIADTRTEKSRAGYWKGRALEAMGRKTDAKAQYREASQYSTLYYGQLAREKIGLGRVPEEIESGEASAAARTSVDKDEVVRAYKMLAKAGGQDQLRYFLWSFAQRFDTVDEMNAAADFVWSEGGAFMAVKFAKAAGTRQVDIDSWGYPIRALPDWKQMGKPVEESLVFALSRQESEFNPTAGSRVGAQGLMQLMPGTAKLIAKQYGVKYSSSKLTADPAYNVQLGAAHLGDLIEDFGGSYVLTLVAYNAGPRRSVEWLKEYGDLRAGEIDPVDWVESIPFHETRQYVQKVLQNLHVYRSRLAPKTVRPMTADLMRGSDVASINTAATEAAAAEAEPAGCHAASISTLISTCD